MVDNKIRLLLFFFYFTLLTDPSVRTPGSKKSGFLILFDQVVIDLFLFVVWFVTWLSLYHDSLIVHFVSFCANVNHHHATIQ